MRETDKAWIDSRRKVWKAMAGVPITTQTIQVIKDGVVIGEFSNARAAKRFADANGATTKKVS